MPDEKAQPVSKLSIYPVSAAIWRNEGKNGAWYSATFERTYKDGDKYKSADNYPADHLLALSKLADLAHTEMLRLRAEDRQATPEAESER